MTTLQYIATAASLLIGFGGVIIKLNDLIKSNKMRIENLEKVQAKHDSELDEFRKELSMLNEIKTSLEVLNKSFEVNMEYIKKQLDEKK